MEIRIDVLLQERKQILLEGSVIVFFANTVLECMDLESLLAGSYLDALCRDTDINVVLVKGAIDAVADVHDHITFSCLSEHLYGIGDHKEIYIGRGIPLPDLEH